MNNNYDHLGVNKIGRNIRKSPPHQSNFLNSARQPHLPQVYNINKNDFRDIVQQLTGSPSRISQEPLPRPTQISNNNAPSMRLQKIRPLGLAPIDVNRPRMPVHPGRQMPPRGGVPYNANIPRPAQYGQPPMPGATIAESPTSAYMRILQNSINDPTQGPSPQTHPQYQQRPHVYGPAVPSPTMMGPPPLPFPSPRTNRPFFPASPTAQFVMPSPSGYMNLLSPLSPYPLLSPGYQQFPPMTPSFSFSPLAQPGIMGPGQQPLPSPGMGFPSPGFFNIASPRWRN